VSATAMCIGGCEMKINDKAAVFASERTLLPWDRVNAAVSRLDL